MNSSRDPFEAGFKIFLGVGPGVLITYINGIFVFTFFKNQVFFTNPRYILYIHLVINDIIMLFLSVTLHVVSYTVPSVNFALCSFLIGLAQTTSENSPLNLAGMALERYIAICRPLHHPQLCSVNRAYIFIGLMWFMTSVPTLADVFIILVNKPIIIFSTSVVCYFESVFGTNQNIMRAISTKSIYLSSVWMTLIFTYFKVLQAAKSASSDQVSARKARNTILLHGIQLLLCMLAYVAPFVNRFFVALFPKSMSVILLISYLLVNVIPRLLSPLIYGVRDKKMFRYVRIYLTCFLYFTKIDDAEVKS